MCFNKECLMLYAVTDGEGKDGISLYDKVEAALKGGVTIVQLREKNMEESEFIKEAVLIKGLCKSYGVPLIINDNVRVAFESGADGVHVGIEDMPVSEIRKMVPEDFIIGATAKTVEQAQSAEKAGADYLGVGAIFPSPTKKNAIPVTKQELNDICHSVNIPVVAIGGININNVDEISGCQIAGIAVVSGIFSQSDIEEATRRLKKKSECIIEQSGK